MCYPPDKNIQTELIADVLQAKGTQIIAGNSLKEAMLKFSNIIDGRGDEDFDVIVDEEIES